MNHTGQNTVNSFHTDIKSTSEGRRHTKICMYIYKYTHIHFLGRKKKKRKITRPLDFSKTVFCLIAVGYLWVFFPVSLVTEPVDFPVSGNSLYRTPCLKLLTAPNQHSKWPNSSEFLFFIS